jgi:DNA processing protein
MSAIRTLKRGGSGYPERLLQLHDPPQQLFTVGPLEEVLSWPGPAVAIVGSRKAADASLRLTRDLAAAAASQGALVISGLALGVDAAAHEGALKLGGATVAVLGCGPDLAYPRTNRRIYADIVRSGLVVSEFPPGTEPAPWRFPARNRIIAALADAVVVVEARQRSGALITADMALELGRDVLAVPGWPSFEGAAGTNGLLKAGAGLIEGAEDLLTWLGLDPASGTKPPTALADEPLLASLRDAAAFPDELTDRLGLAAGEVAAGLVRLEMDGLLARDGDGRWVAASR